jgi:type IV secretory pathway TraG/TraD family ATPase VirD4
MERIINRAFGYYLAAGARASAVIQAFAVAALLVTGFNAAAAGVAAHGFGVFTSPYGLGFLLMAAAAGYVAWEAYERASVTVRSTQHGSAGFTKPRFERDLRRPAGVPLEPGSIFISPGRRRDVVLPRALAVMHVMIVGGSGTGKTRAVFLPTAARSRGTSLVCTDPKGELWRLTSGFHLRARRYAPRDPDRSWCFNWVPTCRDSAVALKLARAVMQQDDDGHAKEQRFFKVGDRNFCAALFQYAATLEEPTPATAYELLSLDVFDLLRLFAKSESPLARRCAADMLPYEEGDSKVVAGIKLSVSQQLAFLESPAIRRFTSASRVAPDFAELRRWPVAVYLVLNEQDLAELQPLCSLFYTLIFHQLTHGPEGESTAVPITMLLDEFGNVGRLPDFVKTIGVTRYRNIALVLGLQSLHQLEEFYGPNGAKTIRTNCATKIALHGMDVDNAEYFSRMLGETTVVTTQQSKSSGGNGRGSQVTTSEVRNQRRLMTPDEVMRLGEGEIIFRTSNRRPMLLKKLYYDERPSEAEARTLGAARVSRVEVPARPARKRKDPPPELPRV